MSRESSAANCASSRVPSTSARWSAARSRDRKSTRLNSSHSQISYAVFCLKKKNQKFPHRIPAQHKQFQQPENVIDCNTHLGCFVADLAGQEPLPVNVPYV